jgi:hypothetical protein
MEDSNSRSTRNVIRNVVAHEMAMTAALNTA